MIRVSRIYRIVLPIEQERISQVKEIFRQNFSTIAEYAEKFTDMLENPFSHGYSTVLLVSESQVGQVTGFALLLVFPNINSGLLDFIAVRRNIRGAGTGSILYEAIREYAQSSKLRGIYLESLPDDPALVKDAAILKENRQRLRFYESYGIRPIIGTEYETPIDNHPAPHLLFDGLDRSQPLKRSECRAAVRTILTKKYSNILKPDYVERVVESIVDDPVRFRDFKFVKKEPLSSPLSQGNRLLKKFTLVSTHAHEIHHVNDRGYVERPVRVKAIKDTLDETGLFESILPKHFSEEYILAVHEAEFVKYLKAVCQKLESKRPVYPYVFPIRKPERRPKDLAVRAGYYCIDTFTPLDKNAYNAARSAVDVSLTAAEQVLQGKTMAYALCRPPGHHAERRVFGGFCYFNNAAIAAQFLSKHGRVAMLDIDFHHGNGAQNIFYKRNDVLNISLHGHPNIAYPYFSGFADETGGNGGQGFNFNFPLPENAGHEMYLNTLEKAVKHIEKYSPMFLIICLGFDVMKGDPTGSFGLNNETMKQIGIRLAQMNLPTLIVQEGGYSLKNLKTGSKAFFNGFAQSLEAQSLLKAKKKL
ncbi:MAG: histone deacetylase family protein [Sedimentisphaerales bacterium]|nr:histone deacetylase family protein [Sedimentisphaerales bacterium]